MSSTHPPGRKVGTPARAEGRTSLFGRLLLSAQLVGEIVLQIGFVWFGWTGEHIFNSAWHPHGRFHAAQFMTFVIALCLLGLWLVWRRSPKPRTGLRIVLAVIVFLSVSQFVASAVPGTSPSPMLTDPNTFSLLGWQVHGNLFLSALMIILAILGYWLASHRSRTSRADSTVKDE